MGYIITLKCKCISNNESYYIGLGIRDFAKATQNELGYCDICHKFDTIGDIQICSCRNALRKIYTLDMLNDNISNITCPRCGNDMSIDITGLWD